MAAAAASQSWMCKGQCSACQIYKDEPIPVMDTPTTSYRCSSECDACSHNRNCCEATIMYTLAHLYDIDISDIHIGNRKRYTPDRWEQVWHRVEEIDYKETGVRLPHRAQRGIKTYVQPPNRILCFTSGGYSKTRAAEFQMEHYPYDCPKCGVGMREVPVGIIATRAPGQRFTFVDCVHTI